MFSLEAPIVRVTGFDIPWPQFAIEKHALITPEMVHSEVRQAMAG